MKRMRTVLVLAATVCIGTALLAARARQSDGENTLIERLRSRASSQEKALACQQLAARGTARAVPALAALLADEALSGYARDALEAIPSPEASAALRTALGSLRGRLLVGVVNSVGVRRDRLATNALARLAQGADREVAAAAIAALGRIGTPEALRFVESALASSVASLRDAAADALLDHASTLAVAGRKPEALATLRRIQGSKAARHVRLAALQCSIVLESPASLPRLLQHLRTNDDARVAMALRALREMQGDAVTRGLADAVTGIGPGVQPAVVQVLRERGGVAALAGLEAVAVRGTPAARLEALRALGELGTATSVPILLRAIASVAEGDRKAAADSLARLRAPGVEQALLSSMAASPPAQQVALLGVAARRPASAAIADAALKLASANDPALQRAALDALATHGRPADLSAIVRRLVASTDDSVRESAGRAALAVAWRVEDLNARTQPFSVGLRDAPNATAKAALLALLGEIATYPALLAATGALADVDVVTRSAAVRALSGWPDPSPTAALLAAAQKETDAGVRVAAIRGAIRLAGAAAAECAPPPGQAMDWLRAAATAIGEDAASQRVLLSALAGTRSLEGLAMVRPFLAAPAVRGEAQLAAIQIARSVPETDRAVARSVIESIAASPASDDIGRRAQEALAELPGPSVELRVPVRSSEEAETARLTFRPLFDGRTFEGWEGDTEKSFRIQDGAIVGGNLKSPIPRNEFLCTTRCYANFVLRLECKTVNANGGIQIRSRRVPRSSELCGYQADMDSSGQYWGSLYDESRRGMVSQADREAMAQIVKRDDWNTYEIRCEGPRIRLTVNGRLSVDYTERDPAIPLSGIIGLQVHGGPPSETWYRNLAIAELP